jgi:cytochrome P450
MTIMRHPDFAFAMPQLDPARNAYLARQVPEVLLAKHGADHRRMRALVSRAMRERVVESLRTEIDAIVDRLIDELPEDGEVDLVHAFTRLLPRRILGPMLGVPYEDVDGIDAWIQISARAIDPTVPQEDLPAIAEAWKSLADYLDGLIEERRGAMGTDIYSELIAAEIGGDRLNRAELAGLASELCRAGVETTRIQMALILELLLTHPGEWAKLKADPELAPRTLEEGMRYAPLPQSLPREARTAWEHGDARFEPGDNLILLVRALNRDPQVFDRPDVFDIAREPKRHMSFGFGMHHCVGVHLARMEMQIALDKLARRIDAWELIEEPEHLSVTRASAPTSLRVKMRRH